MSLSKECLRINNKKTFLVGFFAKKAFLVSRCVMISKLYRFVKIHGFKELFKKIIGVFFYKLKSRWYKEKNAQILKNILTENKNKEIIIFYSPVPWNLPLYQRPHHIAIELSKLNYLYFYCTNNPVKDRVIGYEKITDNCYLTDQFQELMAIKTQKIIQFYSTDMRDISRIYENVINNDDKILYEYIDELHEDITGQMAEYVLSNHMKILKDEKNSIVIASADKLLDDVKKIRGNHFKLVTNGVDIDHFKKRNIESVPDEIQGIINKGKPIIGYFGAFATWFDYELIKKLAIERPHYEILLIGWDYDKSISQNNLDKISNIKVIGPIEYRILPQYAQFFDVSIIPFIINEITESTSPVKLFEYMAMGKPIVTTNMPECKKYNSVLIGKNQNEFIEKIDEALVLKNDSEYLSILRKEAYENTWKRKAEDISAMLLKK